jgi:hypothetical protein
MKKALTTVALIIAVSTLGATAVFAQSLSSAISATSWYSGVCVNLPTTLSYGSTNSDVTRLQVFLVAQNFPGGGSWMETGHYGAATEAAVKDFQQQAGLPMTGIADVATRAAITRTTCGSALLAPAPTAVYPTANPIPWNQYGNNYGTSYQYGNGLVSLNLTSLSQNTGSVGSQVTIYGTGFDATGNTINFGSTALTGVPSNGTSMTFIIPPYTLGGTVNISVTDSRGTSNTLVFTVNQYGYSCGGNYFSGYTSYQNSCGCGTTYPTSIYSTAYPYDAYGNCGTANPPGNTYAPTITYINPVSGSVGTSVTILGTGFTASGNTVHFGTGIITALSSNDGRSVSFTVPSALTGYGSQNTGLGVYNISVTNGSGFTTNVVPFTVTSLNSNGGSLSITSVNGPTSIPAGSIGTWTVTINNPNSTALTVTPNWGDSSVYPYNQYNGVNTQSAPQTVYAGGTATLTFTHVYSTGGTYSISFSASNAGGTQTSVTRSVIVTGSNGYNGIPAISYLSPNSAYVGAQVTIYGSNFASNDTIMFGSGAISSVTSNGSSITFTVPSYVGPYCAPGNACPQYVISITPGTYNVSVMTGNGTSNAVSFTVL